MQTAWPAWWVGKTPIRQRQGCLWKKFELNPWWRLIWVWLELYLTPKRYNLKWNRRDYQLLFRRAAHASRPDLRRVAEIVLKNRKKSVFVIIYYFFECTLKVNLVAKNSGILSCTPQVTPESWFMSQSETTSIPNLFIWDVPPGMSS